MTLRTLAALLVAVLSASSASAAEISVRGLVPARDGRIEIRISGPLATGDARRLTARLESVGLSAGGTTWGMYPIAVLSGSGGSYEEGIRLARLLREYRIPTTVEARAECSGACAIAFMGGSTEEQGSVVPSRSVGAHSRLRLGAPELELPSRVAASDRGAVLAAYDRALRRMAEIMGLMMEHDVSPAFLQRMFAQGRARTLQLSTVDDLGRARVSFNAPLNVRHMTRLMVANFCRNGFSWNAQGSMGTLRLIAHGRVRGDLRPRRAPRDRP
jgi:hypothetical protein